MFRSTLIGCLAGLLMALDGLELVQSRTGLLDIFLMFWIVAGLGAIVRDRDWGRERLADGITVGFWRPWRLLAGICFGGAIATKWTGLLRAHPAQRRRARLGHRRPPQRRLRPAGPPHAAAATAPAGPTNFIVVPIVVYTASFTGWFVTHYGYMRNDYGKGDLQHLARLVALAPVGVRLPHHPRHPPSVPVRQPVPVAGAGTADAVRLHLDPARAALLSRSTAARRPCSTSATRPSGGRRSWRVLGLHLALDRPPRLARRAHPGRRRGRHPAVAALSRAAPSSTSTRCRCCRSSSSALCAMAGLALGQRTDSEAQTAVGRAVGRRSTRCSSSSRSGTSTRSGRTSGSRTTPGTTGSGSPAGSDRRRQLT